MRAADCKPGQVYEDASGRRFIITGVWLEPVILMEEIGTDNSLVGGETGLMWSAFKQVEPEGGDILSERWRRQRISEGTSD